jgi:hypothetical protein
MIFVKQVPKKKAIVNIGFIDQIYIKKRAAIKDSSPRKSKKINLSSERRLSIRVG